MSAHNASGVLIVGGQQIGRYTDLCTSALDNVGKYPNAKSMQLSVDIHTWQKPLGDFLASMGCYDIPMKHHRKVGPRRLRTVWVRRSWGSDVDSCLVRGEV